MTILSNSGVEMNKMKYGEDGKDGNQEGRRIRCSFPHLWAYKFNNQKILEIDIEYIENDWRLVNYIFANSAKSASLPKFAKKTPGERPTSKFFEVTSSKKF